MKTFCRLTLCALILVCMPSRSALAEDEATVKHAVTQARLFVRRGWFRDARVELERAAESQAGRRSFEVFWLLSQVCHELMDMGCALDAARAAAPISPDAQRATALEDLIRYYEGTYGFLTIGAPYESMVSRIQLELLTSLFDPDLKRFVNRRALGLRDRNPLPLEIALPAGRYRVNGHEIEIKANVDQQLVLPISALGARGMAALQVSRVEVTSGVGAFFGDDTADLQPGFDLQVAVTQPFGPVLVGLMVDHSLRNYVVPSLGSYASRGATGIGFRLGHEIPVDAPLGLRPSVGYRFGYLPGIGFQCEQNVGGDLECSDAPNGPVVLHAYGVARVHQPLVELAIEYRKAGRTTAFGSGVKFEAAYVTGAVPETTQVNVAGDPNDVRDVTIADGAVSAVSVRMLANLSFVF